MRLYPDKDADMFTICDFWAFKIPRTYYFGPQPLNKRRLRWTMVLILYAGDAHLTKLPECWLEAIG